MVFLNTAWMRRYQGTSGDTMTGGGSYVADNEFGYEAFNFLPYKGWEYGFFEPGSDKEENRHSIRIERLGADVNDDHLEGIIAVWVAANPRTGGTYIVGWYRNATIYRHVQETPDDMRVFDGNRLEFSVKAKKKDCTLLKEDARVFRIPRGKKGLGRANIWYADEGREDFKRSVFEYIDSDVPPPNTAKRKTSAGRAHQPDTQKRLKVEKKAVDFVTAYYQRWGYVVESFEKDNLGWDLEARHSDDLLRIEVKGLSGDEILFDLTPNEYDKMNDSKIKDSYRIAVVTKALTKKPNLTIFSHNPETGQWEDDDENLLTVTEITGARMTVDTR